MAGLVFVRGMQICIRDSKGTGWEREAGARKLVEGRSGGSQVNGIRAMLGAV